MHKKNNFKLKSSQMWVKGKLIKIADTIVQKKGKLQCISITTGLNTIQVYNTMNQHTAYHHLSLKKGLQSFRIHIFINRDKRPVVHLCLFISRKE